jgi:hypothetical protein
MNDKVISVADVIRPSMHKGLSSFSSLPRKDKRGWNYYVAMKSHAKSKTCKFGYNCGAIKLPRDSRSTPTKNRDRENPRALENHPKGCIMRKIEIRV